MNFSIWHVHEKIRAALRTRRGATHAPHEVPRYTHKSYPRMRSIPLPLPETLSIRLDEALAQRRSVLGGDRSGAFSLHDFGVLFGHALGSRPKGRNYPSGGALYPVETYLVTDRLAGESPAVFHYDPTAHALEYLWPLPPEVTMNDLVPRPKSTVLSALIIFTAVWERSSAKYGDLAYSHGLIESGHMSENILLVATALGIGARPMAGFDDALVTKLLDLDPGEQPVHSVLLVRTGTPHMQ